jgi:hypothetical protein
MSIERDPRTDPRPGDVLEIAGRDGYGPLVINVELVGHYVYFRPEGGRITSDLTIAEWREFARDARVISRGDEEPTP